MAKTVLKPLDINITQNELDLCEEIFKILLQDPKMA